MDASIWMNVALVPFNPVQKFTPGSIVVWNQPRVLCNQSRVFSNKFSQLTTCLLETNSLIKLKFYIFNPMDKIFEFDDASKYTFSVL